MTSRDIFNELDYIEFMLNKTDEHKDIQARDDGIENIHLNNG